MKFRSPLRSLRLLLAFLLALAPLQLYAGDVCGDTAHSRVPCLHDEAHAQGQATSADQKGVPCAGSCLSCGLAGHGTAIVPALSLPDFRHHARLSATAAEAPYRDIILSLPAKPPRLG